MQMKTANIMVEGEISGQDILIPEYIHIIIMAVGDGFMKLMRGLIGGQMAVDKISKLFISQTIVLLKPLQLSTARISPTISL